MTSSPSGLPDVTRLEWGSHLAHLFESGDDLRSVHADAIDANNAVKDAANERALRRALERQQRTFDLAMMASHMGTWRYTLADNICLYDENAQRLYGLTDARFLHDDAGARSKFHPDDLDRMWTRVTAALDATGDGRYDVEYRVKQLDGSWRWLSAWGLVEFEGDGPDRRPVAIAGASRDLTDRKRAEALEQLVTNELNHRVKNTLAIVQSLVIQSFRGAVDLDSAQKAVEARIRSLAHAHDLLIDRNWSGADLRELVARVLAPFASDHIDTDGPSLEVSPKQTLALSLALNELATNAAKYGALSRPGGRVKLRWEIKDAQLNLSWRETGGPPVIAPSRRGFGSRLLEEVLRSDLGGETKLEFPADGVHCVITAPCSESAPATTAEFPGLPSDQGATNIG